MSQWGNLEFKLTTDASGFFAGFDKIERDIRGWAEKIARTREDVEEKRRNKEYSDYQKHIDKMERARVNSIIRQQKEQERQDARENKERLKAYHTQVKELNKSIFPNIGKDMLDAMSPRTLSDTMMEGAASWRRSLQKSTDITKNNTKIGEEFGKKMRKSITGVLIDLHWLRVLGQASSVLAGVFGALSKALGYIMDMILLPLLPGMLFVVKWLIQIGNAIKNLPAPLRTFLALTIASGIALTTTTIYTVALGAAAKFASKQLVELGLISGKSSFSAAFVAGATIIGAVIGAVMLAWLSGQSESDRRAKMSKSERGNLDTSMLLRGAVPGGIGPIEYLSYLTGGDISKVLDKKTYDKLPHLAEGGITTGSTLANIGEAGAEAIIPLSSISSTFSNIFGGITESLGNILGITMGKAISGGGGYGALANDRKGSNKGFNYLGEIFFGQTKVSNQLLGGILAVLMGVSPPPGGSQPTGEPKSIWDYILTPIKDFWDWVATPVHSVWEWIVVTIKNVWEFIDVTIKVIWDFIETPIKSVWEFIATPVKSIWEFITTSGAPVGTDAETPIAEATAAVLDLAEVSLTIRQVMASLSMAIPTNDFWDRFKDSVNSGLDIKTALEQTFQALGFELPGAGFWEKLEAALTTGVNPQTGLSQSVTANDIGQDIANSVLQNLVGGENVGGQTIREPFVQVATNVMEEVQETVTDVGTTTGSFLDTVINTVEVLGGMVLGGVGDLANGVGSVLADVGNAVFGAGSAIDAFFTDVAKRFSELTGSSYGTGGGGGTVLAPPPVPPVIAALASGGYIESNGLAFLHEGETVVPANVNRNGGSGGGGIVINNPTFVVSGRDERAMFEEIMRLMKLESSRVRAY